jgi:CTP:molybdopterin cytidylyltransferase MocA
MTTTLVLLAAGRGTRAGGPKAWRAIRQRPFVAFQLERVRRSFHGPIRVVLGREAAIERDLACLGLDAQTDVVLADDDATMFASLRAGLCDVVGRALVHPIDCPWPSATHTVLADAMDAHPNARAAMPTWNDRGGHPVLLSAPLVASIHDLDPTSRLDHVLRGLGGSCLRVPVAQADVLRNLNTPTDWTAFEAELSG